MLTQVAAFIQLLDAAFSKMSLPVQEQTWVQVGEGLCKGCTRLQQYMWGVVKGESRRMCLPQHLSDCPPFPYPAEMLYDVLRRR